MMNRITAVAYPTPQPSDSFGYYLDGELKTANLGNLGHNLTYNLDNKGNRTSVVDSVNGTTTYSPNTIDQFSSVSGNSITNGLDHQISAFNGVTYNYINDERLSSVQSGSTIYSMVYDALGRCVKRSITGGSATYYIYDGDKPILEYDANTGASVGSNLYGKGVDEILERVAGASAYFLHQNHEGSVTLLTDVTTSANVIERYRYDAFGAPTIYTPTWGSRSATLYDNRFLFTGREYAATYRAATNTAFSFFEYRARAYNPKLGRFMGEDPKLFDAGDYNLFRYCHNDPIDFTDPMGLDTVDNVQVGLDAAGLIPGIGAIADVASGAISLARGDYVGVGLSLAAAIPVAGEGAGAAKLARSSLRAEGAIQAARTSSKIDRAAFRAEREAFWKAEAKSNAEKYSRENLARMEKGKAPIGPDGHSMELHHKDRTPQGGVEPMSRTDHRLGENYQKNHPPTDFKPNIDKKAQEHASDVIHSKPDPNPQ